MNAVVAPSGELRGKDRCGVFAGKTVWSTSERLRGEVLTTRRYTNLRLPLPLYVDMPTILAMSPIFSQMWLRYVWLMAWQIRLSVACDVRAPYTQGV